MMKSRYFNDLQIHKGIITKHSSDNFPKLESEYNWLKLMSANDRVSDYIPEDLLIDPDNHSYSMKYYKSGNIYDIIRQHKKDIKDIIDDLLKVLIGFNCQLANNSIDDSKFYVDKTYDRISKFDDYFRKDKYYINNVQYDNRTIIDYVLDKVKTLNDSSIDTIIHGDFIFSNILYNNGDYKVIDPRGEIFGDCRYDLAKLRHSIHGGYEYIINDRYKFREICNGQYEYTIKFDYNAEDATRYFDHHDLVYEDQEFIDNVKFIEGLLFLTMLPLHKENLEHQKIFFGQALSILKECMEK